MWDDEAVWTVAKAIDDWNGTYIGESYEDRFSLEKRILVYLERAGYLLPHALREPRVQC